MTPSLLEQAQAWLDIDRDEITRAELQALIDQQDEVELAKRLTGRISFGTAGLRGRMGTGSTCMNCVTVIQASQGLAAHLLAHHIEGVVVGRDARHNSEKFARIAAAAFMAAGLKVHWFENIVPTPLVPFAVSQMKGKAAGVMVTASHNPPQDNGYKVYWSTGCQIIPPHDIAIAAAIEANLTPISWHLDEADSLFRPIDGRVELEYIERVSKLAVIRGSADRVPRFCYTPMHGVGLHCFSKVVSKVLGTQTAGDSGDVKTSAPAHLVIVPEQALPDPDFPTVLYPNPEERGALDLAMRTADAQNIRLILAHDPDADRLAVAEFVGELGKWHQFTGNEIGILLASYALDLYSNAGKIGKIAMLCSTVSSGMLRAMADVEGFHFVETLTGFKWLGNSSQELGRDGYDAVYAFEEALGYMFTEVVYDKDGITAGAALLAAMAHWCPSTGQSSFSLWGKLQSLYDKYGYFASANTYLTSPNPDVTAAVFAAIRAKRSEPYNVRPTLLGTSKILYWRDLTTGYDSRAKDGKPILPVDPRSQMITCEMEHEIRFTCRGSGTEPKIKLYVESTATSREEAEAKSMAAQQLIIREWFEPDRYGLCLPA